MTLTRRLINFLADVAEGVRIKDIGPHARKTLFQKGEEDTAVYVYDQFDIIEEQHHESDLVVKLGTGSDGRLKITAHWHGANIVLEGNFPAIGWGNDEGEFGMGGDWWREK